MKKLMALLLLALIFVGCASTELRESKDLDRPLGQWEAKAQIKDLKTGKAQQVSLDIISSWPDSLRMEVSGTLGVSIATLVLKDSRVSYSLNQQKKYFAGEASEKSLRPMFAIDVHPAWLMNICFDKPIVGNGWKCEMDPSGNPVKCERPEGNTVLSWSDRDGEKKRVTVKGQEYEVQVLFKSHSTKVQWKKGLLELNPPDGFRRYKLL